MIDPRQQMREVAACRRAQTVVAGLLIDDGAVLRRTDKAITVAGSHHGDAVVAKILMTDDGYWAGRFAHEAEIYRAFALRPPSWRLPRLHHADRQLLVLQRLPGAVAHTDRFPPPLPPSIVDNLIDSLSVYGSWHPPPGAAARPVIDYQQRLDADVAGGWLAAPVARLVRQILDTYEFRFAHGDPLPSNALLAAPELPVWIDFEHSGMYPPTTDLAVVAVTLGLNDPAARERCRQQAENQGLTAPYAALLVQLLTRERRLHVELFDQSATSAQLGALDAFAEAAVAALLDSTRRV